VVLALTAAFFGWVSAEPFWLAVGHGRAGTATVLTDSPPCEATFIADGGAFVAGRVDLQGVDPGGCTAGAEVDARMVSANSDRAYAADPWALHLRWLIGFTLVLLCGLAITWVTGATRFSGWQRTVTVGLSLAAPVGVVAAMLAAAF
jgi:hypothetical protein